MSGRRGRRGPSISLVCATRHPAELVTRALAPLVGVVDEIVVAADARVPAAEVRRYRSVADRVVRFPFVRANHFRPWLLTLGRGDWTLVLDGDETPGEDLRARLPDLVRDRDCAGVVLPCRWIHPDTGTYLASAPWADDRHLRLVRNDDRVWHPGEKHAAMETTGPVRRVDAPFYHLDLALTDVASRRAKVGRYRGEAPPLLAPDGDEANRAYYLPEDRADLVRAPVPGADRRLLERVVAGPPRRRRAPRPGRAGRVVDRADLDRVHPAHHEESPYRAVTAIRRAPAAVPAGAPFDVEVLVRNTGRADIPVAAPQMADLRLSYHWTTPDGTVTVLDGLRTPLPHRLRAGEAAPMALVVMAPADPGPHRLVVDLVHEGRRWLRAECTAGVEVGPPIAALLAEAAGADGRVPVARCRELRRHVPRADGLAEAARGPAAPQAVAVLDGALPADGGTVVVLGAGPGVVPVVECLADAGVDPGRVRVFADTPERGAWCRRALEDAVAAPPSVRLAPGAPTRADSGGEPPSLVVVGGTHDLGREARSAWIPALGGLVDRPTPMVALDGLADAVLAAADAWERAGVTVLGVRPGPPAALDCVLRPTRAAAAAPG